MPFQPDSPELENYIKLIADSKNDFSKVRHATYEDTVDHMLRMAVHCVADPNAENPKTVGLIRKRRPNEDDAVFNHRVDNYRQNTLAHYKKIKNTLEKVFNDKLTGIDYPEMPRNIESTLELYLANLPVGKAGKTMTIRQYTRSISFESMLRDANGVQAIIPTPSSIEDETAFIAPIPVYFPSDQVIDYGMDYFLLLTTMQSPEDPNGAVLFLIDSEYIHIIWELEQIKGKRRFKTDVYYRHDLGEVPVVPMEGDEEMRNKEPIKYSYISGILPNFDEALVLKSDSQALKVRVNFPLRWRLTTRCRRCKGTGELSGAYQSSGAKIKCGTCNGSGISSMGPSDEIILDTKEFEDRTVPTPPAGYIEPNYLLIREIDSGIQTEINQGLSAIGMDHLRKDTNIQESGIAKVVGREDLHTFMDVIATAIYSIEWQSIYFIAAMRYGPGGIRPEEIVPVIQKPKEYDLLTSSDHIVRIGEARDKGISSAITGKMELDLLSKEFGDDSGIYLLRKTLMELDPLPDLKPEQVISIEPHTKEIDLWMHFNLERLVRQALDQNENFFSLPRGAKFSKIKELAESEIMERDLNNPPIEPPVV